jgi:cell division protein FtsW
MKIFSRTDRSFLSQWWWTLDRPLLWAIIALAGFGVMLVATASPSVAAHHNLHPYHFLIRHGVVLGPALCVMMAVSMLSPRTIWRIGSVLMLLSLSLMVWVLFSGMEIKGAQRWVDLGVISLQPAEFLKPAFAICSAWFMARKSQDWPQLGYGIAISLYAVSVMLLLLQPDFGMTFVLTCIWSAQILIAGIPLRLVLILLAVAACGIVAIYSGFSHVQSRIDRFLDPSSGDNYQVERSLEAFRSGGVFGTGPGHGVIKNSLPDAHADFIFSVAGEELGLVFVIPLIALIAFIVLRGLLLLARGQDLFCLLCGCGLLTMLGMQALIHMGSALNILPAKGMTLPLISYGGSSLLSVCFSLGVILTLTRKQGRSTIALGGLALKS